jgi:hypothetical protein
VTGPLAAVVLRRVDRETSTEKKTDRGPLQALRTIWKLDLLQTCPRWELLDETVES